ncbi:MAG TPA: mandelate racemase/muconate lactonizing enzyme family protein [Terriglobia bacterium]|nr:mandelate racemase/muconate lactonizing enzyme family protein [Terriglobia bacterium]
MKIIRVETVEFEASTAVHAGMVSWLWVRLYGDNGLIGLGETFPASWAEKPVVLKDFAPQLIGRDPRDIEAIWRDLFVSVQYRGWAGAEIRALSAVDVALWDLLAKSAGLPLYRLLGGKCRDTVPIYNTCYDDHYDFTRQPAELAQDLAASGIHAMKIWPFDSVAIRNRGQTISAAEIDECLGPVRAIRQALGMSMEIAMEFHGYWNLPSSIKIARALEPYSVMWLEEMLPQDNPAAYAVLAQKVSQPLCISERLLTRWGFREILETGAASVIMPDIAWCGGLSEARKIAGMAETYYLPVAFHNCGGPITHFASWHLSTATPNLKILETVRRHYADRFLPVVTSPGAPENGVLGIPPGPGLGTDLRPDFLDSNLVKIESFPSS